MTISDAQSQLLKLISDGFSDMPFEDAAELLAAILGAAAKNLLDSDGIEIDDAEELIDAIAETAKAALRNVCGISRDDAAARFN